METKPNDAAFAETKIITGDSFDGGLSEHIVCSGLTKREYFAAAAMQGYLSGKLAIPIDVRAALSVEIVAKHSVEFADALVIALNEDKVEYQDHNGED